MCPNAACEQFQHPTGLIGGCDCGTALVNYYVPPTDEQLENFARAILTAEAARQEAYSFSVEFAVLMIMERPDLKAQWLKRHRKVQESVN